MSLTTRFMLPLSCCVALLIGLLRSPEPARAPTLSLDALRERLNAQLWPTYPLSVSQPELPSQLCTPPLSTQAFSSALVMGDTRADRAGLGPSARWPSLSTEALKRNPQLLVHLGDWVTRGGELIEWRYALEAALQMGLPILTVRGNHDRGPHWPSLGLDATPSTRSARSPLRVTRVGETLVYLLDTETTALDAREAVEAHAQASGDRGLCFQAQQVLWLQHRPIWSRGPHGSDERGWAHWLVPALERLGVQLLLAGHDHNYERMERSLGVGAERRATPSGLLYLTSGGAGAVTAPLPDLSWRVSAEQRTQDRALSAHFSGAPHTLSLSFGEEGLQITAWSTPREGVSERIDEAFIEALRPHQNGIGIRLKGR